MAIEVKQMLIRSTVVQRHEANIVNREQSRALDEIKEDILAECRQLIREILREEQER
jgi:hypothetical protein